MTAPGPGPGPAIPTSPVPTSFTPMAVAARLDGVRAALPTHACDALLVTHLPNIRYLTGFTGSAATVVVTPDEVVFITDGRYGEQAAEQLAGAGVVARIEVAGQGQRDLVVRALEGSARLGLEADHISWGRQRELAEHWFTATELVPTTGLVEELRLVKDRGEIERLAAASAIADQALANVRGLLANSPTELAFGLALDTEMRNLGAEGPSFETIVASGPNGARPHARPSERRIEPGDLVVLDFGALVDGYHSDMSRTIMVGDPSPTQQRMLDVVAASQQAGVDAVRAGVSTGDIDAACRAVIDEAGWGDAFLHATGHGVGLDIHEGPRVGAGGDATLTAGNVVTVEPGVYLPDHGGVRIEDTVVVTSGGCDVLTAAPKRTTL